MRLETNTMSHLKVLELSLRNGMSSFCITLEAHPPEVSYVPAGHVGTAHTGSVWLCWKPREPARLHPRCSGHDQREKPEVRRELFLEGPGKAPLFWNVEESPGLMVLVEKMVPSGLMLDLFPRCLCQGKSCNFFQYGLPLFSLVRLKYQMYVVSACEGCWLKFLYFMSFPYWRKWPGLAPPQAAALSYRRRARCRS